MEFSSGSSSEDFARPFHLEGVDRGQFLCKQSCRSLVVKESSSPGGRLAERAFFAPQATEHDINTQMDWRSAIGSCELLNNDFNSWFRGLSNLFLGGKLGTLKGGIPFFKSIGNHLMHWSLRNLLTYENKLVRPIAFFHSHHEHWQQVLQGIRLSVSQVGKLNH